jgi:hypothetical protein
MKRIVEKYREDWEMGLFKRFARYNKELDYYLTGVANNAANNYKDAAQQDFKAFVAKFEELKAAGELNENQTAYYTRMKNKYEQELRGFHH